jgi:hypothetical protein
MNGSAGCDGFVLGIRGVEVQRQGFAVFLLVSVSSPTAMMLRVVLNFDG